MDSRQQFEEWYKTSGMTKYKETALAAWQASRELLVIELPRGFSTDYCNGDAVFDAEEVMFTITKAGAKYK